MIHDHHTITQRLGGVTRRGPLLALLASVFVLGPPVSAAEGANVSRDVEKFTVSPDTLCGFTGTSNWVLDITTGPTANGSSFTAGPVVRTFVADNGRGVKITYEDGVVTAGPTVYYPDGSSSFTAVEDGLAFKTQALGGPLLEQGTGRVTFTVYLDANGNFVSQTIDSTTGPVNVTGPDCSIVGPYLAAG